MTTGNRYNTHSCFLLSWRLTLVLPQRWPRFFCGPLLVLLLAGAVPAGAVDVTALRAQMVEEIVATVQLTRHELGKSALDARVLRVLSTVPRHEFVPESERPYAYEDRPLPIGAGQTISQPYIVAIMTDLLDLKPDQVVFEYRSRGWNSSRATQPARQDQSDPAQGIEQTVVDISRHHGADSDLRVLTGLIIGSVLAIC